MSHDDLNSPVRRRLVGAGLGAAGAAALSALPLQAALAQGGEIVVAAAPPISGVFAFAGVGLHQGLGDYCQWRNEAKKGVVSTRTALGELYLPTEGLIDIVGETLRLTKELDKIAEEIAKVEQKLGNPSFVNKVPVNVLQEHQKRLGEWVAKQLHVKKSLSDLGES